MTQRHAINILVRLDTAVFALREALACADKAHNHELWQLIAPSFKSAVEARDAARRLVTRPVERKTE